MKNCPFKDRVAELLIKQRHRLLGAQSRPPHRWRRRDPERRFLIAYLGSAENPAASISSLAPRAWRYAAAVFRLGESSDRLLLWVADQQLGATTDRVEGVHGATRRDLWAANEEAIEWCRIVEELGESPEFRALTSFAEFEHAVGGLVTSTIPSLPGDLTDNLGSDFGERNFDLWCRAPSQHNGAG